MPLFEECGTCHTESAISERVRPGHWRMKCLNPECASRKEPR